MLLLLLLLLLLLPLLLFCSFRFLPWFLSYFFISVHRLLCLLCVPFFATFGVQHHYYSTITTARLVCLFLLPLACHVLLVLSSVVSFFCPLFFFFFVFVTEGLFFFFFVFVTEGLSALYAVFCLIFWIYTLIPRSDVGSELIPFLRLSPTCGAVVASIRKHCCCCSLVYTW